jgi:thioredoxin reductase (NADPH)
MPQEIFDSLIIGAGPAGLTAAIYLARFRLRVLVLDDGNSRAAQIPMTRNHAGFPDGISGEELLARMLRQAENYGARVRHDRVERLEHSSAQFWATAGGEVFTARTVLLATGVINRRPPMADDLHSRALTRGLLRYCPICDGYEVIDKSIAVVGTGERGFKEAIFLRSYSSRITLISPAGEHNLTKLQRRELKRAGVLIIGGPALRFELGDDKILLSIYSEKLAFDTLYPALGSEIRSELAVALAAEVSQDGSLVVDSHQQSSVTGLFAAGDVVLGLDQISQAMGQGGVAATAIRNYLAEMRPLYR